MVIPDGMSENVRSGIVNFRPGATAGILAPASSQILITTAGRGVVEDTGSHITVTDASDELVLDLHLASQRGGVLAAYKVTQNGLQNCC
jgi:hypothetical protein